MSNLTVRPNRMYFALALAFGFIAVVKFPPKYFEQVVEIPLPALYLGELGFVLMATLLFYDRATPKQVLQLASWMLGFSMFVGAVGNLIDRSTQFMSDYFVLMNLVQLVIMNLAGLLAALTLFCLEDSCVLFHIPSANPKPAEPAPQPHGIPLADESNPLNRLIDSEDFSPPELLVPGLPGTPRESRPTESAKEILEQLDVSRITRLERSLHPEEVSLETLFGEESHAAQLAKLPGEPGGPTLLGPTTKDIIALPATEQILQLEMKPDESCLPEGTPAAPTIPSAPDLTKTMRRIPIASQALPASTYATDFDPQVFKTSEEEDPELKIIRELAAKVRQSGNHSEFPKSTFQSLLKTEPMACPLSVVPKDSLNTQSIKDTAHTDSSTETYDHVFEASVDEAVEHVFATLVPTEAQLEVSPETLAKLKLSEPGNSIEQSTLLTAKEPKEIKEFGRLSQDVSGGSNTDSSIGTMKTIGRLLLDTQAIENIIKVGQQPGLTTARVVSMSQGMQLHQHLENINSLPGVTGCILVGFDGLVITSTMADESEKESLGALSLSIHGSSNVASEKLDLGTMQQIILQSAGTITVLTNVPKGVLVVFASCPNLESISTLLEAIEKLIASDESELLTVEDEVENVQSIRTPVAADLVRELIDSLADKPPDSIAVADSKPLDIESTHKPKEIKEFGRLSAGSHCEPQSQDTGAMKTIGKLLIDPQAIANIIKAGETGPRGLTTARVISAARGEGIRSLLGQIDSYPGVAGSLIVGHDGLVIASTLAANLDKDLLGAMSIAIHS
ncbi:MAG: roadblock/LC7 domain-containing protein, partial [Candidatus Melainabacteria bacterium]|nr:roadblock/LC7 domain-containing protein [Candidatus Melainabacteria bacterium]